MLTCFWSDACIRERNEQFLHDDDGDLVRGDPQELSAMVRDAVALAPILLDHVNDTHFHVRSTAASAFRALFRHWIDRGEGRRSSTDSRELPDKIDWTGVDWQTRHDTQENWKRWWEAHGAEALRRAHPGAEDAG